MIIKSRKFQGKRERETVHVQGWMTGAEEKLGPVVCVAGHGKSERLFNIEFSEQDLPALKVMVSVLSKSKGNKK